MEILTFPVTPFVVNCYVLKDGDEAIVVDPGDTSPAILESLDGCSIRAIINTHCHCDHCGGNAALKEKTGAELLIHEAELLLLEHMEEQGQMFGVCVTPSPPPDRFIKEGDTIRVGSVELSVLEAPGHSPGARKA